MEQKDVRLTWAWDPEDIGGRKMIICQDNRVEDKTEWSTFTDAIRHIECLSYVESVGRHESNKKVYTVTFTDTPTLQQVREAVATINNILRGAALSWYRGCKMHPSVAERLRDDEPFPVQKIMAGVEDGSVTKRDLKKLRGSALRTIVNQLQLNIDQGRMTYREAWDLLKTLIPD